MSEIMSWAEFNSLENLKNLKAKMKNNSSERTNHTMNITEVKVRKISSEGQLKAIVSIVINNCLAIHEIKIIEGASRLFVAMPSRKDENGIFRDIIHPIDPEARKEFEDVILDEYYKYTELEKVLNDEEYKD